MSNKLRHKISLGEKIFDLPLLYKFKINFLNRLNRLKIPIDPLIKGKEILDIGCGSYQVRYNPNLAKRRVGIDSSIRALQEADKLYPNSRHLVASADKLPFASKSFDITLILFTLHHLSKKQWINALREAKRVTREKIIIYDHISSDNPIFRKIQHTYWKIFDGGETYPLESEWQKALKKLKVKKYLRLGSLFKHICFYIIDIAFSKR